MNKIRLPHRYHQSFPKKLFDYLLSFFGLILFSPLIATIAALIKITSSGSPFFTQKRVGKNGSILTFIKFRTMGKLAERQKGRLLHLNEADGPVFKIRNDPRYTKIGKFLAHTGLDELPQLINVLKGEMSLVGPRPLPVSEARKIPKKYKIRESIKPGITSNWVIKGSHFLSFEEWMKLDEEYVRNASIYEDVRILFNTVTTLLQLMSRKIF